MSIYLEIPGIKGSVTKKGYEDLIEISKFSWGLARSIKTRSGHIKNRESGSPDIKEVRIEKLLDPSSVLLFGQAAYGKALPEVKIYASETGEDNPEFLRFTLRNVIISGYHIEGESQNTLEADDKEAENSSTPTEVLTLNFDKIEMKYTPFDSEHNAQAPIHAGFDLETAEKV